MQGRQMLLHREVCPARSVPWLLRSAFCAVIGSAALMVAAHLWARNVSVRREIVIERQEIVPASSGGQLARCHWPVAPR